MSVTAQSNYLKLGAGIVAGALAVGGALAVSGAITGDSILVTGAVQGADVQATDDVLVGDDVTFDVAGASATISQTADATNSATCDPLDIAAQSCTGTTTVGGTSILRSGDGTTDCGAVRIESGTTAASTTRARSLLYYNEAGSDEIFIGSTGPDAAFTRPINTVLDASSLVIQRVAGSSRLSTSATAVTNAVGWALTGIISPTALSNGNNNNWNPTGLNAAAVIRVDLAAGAVLTGITAQASGRVIMLTNISANDLAIDHNDSDSSSANQISLPNAVQLVLTDNQSVTLWYDGTSTKWRTWN